MLLPECRCVYGGVCPMLSPIRGFLLLMTSLWMRRLWYLLFLKVKTVTSSCGQSLIYIMMITLNLFTHNNTPVCSSGKRKTSKSHHISLWRLKIRKNHQHRLSPRVGEDSLHASIIRVSILHVISAPPCSPQLFLIVCTHKHNNHVVTCNFQESKIIMAVALWNGKFAYLTLQFCHEEAWVHVFKVICDWILGHIADQ